MPNYIHLLNDNHLVTPPSTFLQFNLMPNKLPHLLYLDDGPLLVLDGDGEGVHDAFGRVVRAVAEHTHRHKLSGGGAQEDGPGREGTRRDTFGIEMKLRYESMSLTRI